MDLAPLAPVGPAPDWESTGVPYTGLGPYQGPYWTIHCPWAYCPNGTNGIPTVTTGLTVLQSQALPLLPLLTQLGIYGFNIHW